MFLDKIMYKDIVLLIIHYIILFKNVDSLILDRVKMFFHIKTLNYIEVELNSLLLLTTYEFI